MILTALTALLSLVLSPVTATGADAERRLEAAIQREIVLGDLKGAMAQYQTVIREAASKAP